MDAPRLCDNDHSQAPKGEEQATDSRPTRRLGKGRVTIVGKLSPADLSMVPDNRANEVRSAPLPRCPACDVCATHQVSRDMVESILQQNVQAYEDTRIRLSQILIKLADLEGLLSQGSSEDSGSDGELPDND